jgi:3-methyladenine DNA glycosylase AlkD
MSRATRHPKQAHGSDHLARELIRRVAQLETKSTQPLRRLRQEFSRRLISAPAPEVMAVAMQLLSEPGIEHRFLAYELVSHHLAAMRGLGLKELETLGRDLDSWGAFDTFACYLSGPAWRNRQVPDRDIHLWARSKDRWWRRTALVSTVPLNCKARGGHGDSRRTLAVCRLLLADQDDMVVKALSWALRELAKRDPAAVSAFLDDHASVLAARVLREVRNKLNTGLKNPRKE